jgi:hypothetical protein
MNEQSKKELAESLWMEINRAILNSNRVRDCLNTMKQKDMLDYLCQHDFLLDGKKLIEEMLDEPNQPDAPENKRQESLKGSVEMFLGEQGRSLPWKNFPLFRQFLLATTSLNSGLVIEF